MKDNTKEILCDSDLMRVREEHMERLDALFRGERLDRAFVLWGITGGRKRSQTATRKRSSMPPLIAWRKRQRKHSTPMYTGRSAWSIGFAECILRTKSSELKFIKQTGNGGRNQWQPP